MAEAVFFGTPGMRDSVLQGKWVDYFGGPAPIGIDSPTWLGYSDPGQDQVTQAQTLLNDRAHSIAVDRDGWLLVCTGTAAGTRYHLVRSGNPTFVAAQHLAPAPDDMSEDNMFAELVRLAAFARATA